MGNCQAAEATAVVIHHPSGSSGGVGGGGRRVDRAHGAVSAAAVMAANPGHYVAAVIPASTTPTASGRQTKAPSATRAAPLRRRLKLLRPDDTLMVGGVYRLVSFEDVLTLFVSKRRPTPIHVEIPADDEDQDHRRRHGGPPEPGTPPAKGMAQAHQEDPSSPSPDDEPWSEPEPEPDSEPDYMAAAMALRGRHSQWRPALPSIAEGSVVC